MLQEGIIFDMDLILQQGKIFLRLLRSMGIKEGIFMDISYEVPARYPPSKYATKFLLQSASRLRISLDRLAREISTEARRHTR